MKTIEESIEIEVPLTTAYNQWTQFESFPQFMEGVERVEQKGDTRLHWVADVGGERREWDAEITEQHPDERVAWKSVERPHQAGVVQMEYEPEGTKESMGSFVGLDSRRVKGDLESFKEFVEGRAHETGAWRGDVQQN